MKIDFHAHILPPAIFGELKRHNLNVNPGFGAAVPPKLAGSLEERLKDMDSYGVDMQVLSMGPPGVDLDGASPAITVELARMVNDYIAEAVAKHPKRFQGLAVLPLQDVEKGVEELTRAVKKLGLKGAHIFSNVKGRTLDSREFSPLYEKASELDVLLYLHPTKPLSMAGLLDLELMIPVGVLFESSLAMTRLIVRGTLDRFPSLKLALAHLGSTLPYIAGRLDIEGISGDRPKISKLPSAYLRDFYVDTVSHHKPAYMCALETCGIDRIILGSDYPYSLWKRTVDAIEELPIPKEDKEKIFFGNARGLLKLSV